MVPQEEEEVCTEQLQAGCEPSMKENGQAEEGQETDNEEGLIALASCT